MTTPLSSVKTTHGLTLWVNNQIIGAADRFEPSLGSRTIQHCYEIQARGVGHHQPRHVYPKRTQSRTATLSGVELWEPNWDRLWSLTTNGLVAQQQPLKIVERWTLPKTSVEDFISTRTSGTFERALLGALAGQQGWIYDGVLVSSAGRSFGANDERTARWNMTVEWAVRSPLT